MVMTDIDGTLNIADDILIYAKNTQEHDQIFSKVFARLAEKRVILNLANASLTKQTLNFMVTYFHKTVCNQAKAR